MSTKKTLSRNDKVLYGLLGLSGAIIVLGILFLLNAMQDMDDPNNIAFFKAFSEIDNILGKYIIVILTMSCGIMLFSNVALRMADKKVRNGLTISITIFAFILTLPLVYVFVSLIPFAVKYNLADMPALGDMNAIDQIMRTDRIYGGFAAWFGEGAFLWVVLAFMLVLSIVFLLEPLAAGICVTKGKLLQLFGKNRDGKFRIISVIELPILKKQCKVDEGDISKNNALTENISDGLMAEAAADIDEQN